MAYSYNRRNEIARSKGFSSYGEYRRATEYANRSREFEQKVGHAGGYKGENLDAARTYYQAYKEGEPNDYTLHKRGGKLVVTIKDGKPSGAKAKWVIDYAGYVDEAEWRRRYPRGRRRG